MNKTKLSIEIGEVTELFVVLDELDESQWKTAVSFIRQGLESEEEGAMEVNLIDITEDN